MLHKNKILLIVSGGIAAYKSLELVRLLKSNGFQIFPVMTASANNFVTPLSLSVLAGEKVLEKLYDLDSEMNPRCSCCSSESDALPDTEQL